MPNATKNHLDPALIAIVGGGFSGVATAIRLLSSRVTVPRQVTLIESSSLLGRGTAYRTENDAHLLNVPAGRMNPLPGEPGRFLEWLRARVSDASGGSFVPRRWFGAYLDETLRGAASGAGGLASLEVRHGRVVRLSEGDGTVELSLGDGPPIQANRVVLANGHAAPAVLRGASPAAVADPRYVADPWVPGWAGRIHPDAPVLLVGSGLTMVDAVLELRSAGHHGPLRAVSRHGLLPSSHRGLPKDPVRQPHPPALDTMAPTTLAYLRVIRSAVRQAEEHGLDWRDVIASLRPVTARLWRRLPPAERARFLRHARAQWDAHRHRAAPEVALRIAVLGAKRKLKVTAARVRSIDVRADGLVARLQLRAGGEEEVVAGAVINCTGPDTDLSRSADPLLRSLLDGGVIRQDPLRLGIETGENGEVIGRDGAPSSAIYYVGPMLQAGWWEATAVPELAAHALRTADAILTSL